MLGWLGTFRRVRKILSNGSFIIRYEYVIYLTRERLAPEGFRSVSARSAIRVRFMRHMLWDVFLFFFFSSLERNFFPRKVENLRMRQMRSSTTLSHVDRSFPESHATRKWCCRDRRTDVDSERREKFVVAYFNPFYIHIIISFIFPDNILFRYFYSIFPNWKKKLHLKLSSFTNNVDTRQSRNENFQ